MEMIAVFALPVVVGAAVFRLLLLPVRLLWKLVIHAAGGLICLWLMNSLAAYTGVFFPVNPVSVLIAGLLGVPGIMLLAALELL